MDADFKMKSRLTVNLGVSKHHSYNWNCKGLMCHLRSLCKLVREQWTCLQAEKGPVSGRDRNGWVDKVWEERPGAQTWKFKKRVGEGWAWGTQNVSVWVPEGPSGVNSNPGTAPDVPSAELLVTNLHLGQVHSTDFSLRMVLLGILLQRQK